MGRPPQITRQQVVDTARAVFVQRGFEAATLAEIAELLNVSAAAVLRHCGSKQQLFAMAMEGVRIELPEIVTALDAVDPGSDPRLVLRALAEGFIPIVQATIGQNLAVYMHGRSHTSFVVPFDTSGRDTPPRQGLRIVSNYFRRAANAGVLRVHHPRAAALLFLGSLHSYVFLHQVLRVSEKPFPLTVWIDQLIDLWTNGVITGGPSGHSKDHGLEKSRPHRSAAHSRHDGGVVDETQAAAGRASRVRDDRGADGQRGLTVRRPRRGRLRR